METKLKNFRLGNYIQGMYDGDEELFCNCTIVCLDNVGACEYPITVESEKNCEYFYEFKELELTEEMLLKLGFEKRPDNGFKKDGFMFYGFKVADTIGYHFRSTSFSKELKYVHQLQNLYYLVTDKELVFL
jgi:hypothetical protein